MDIAPTDQSEDTQKDLATTLAKERRFWTLDAIHDLLTEFSPGDRLVLYVLSVLLALSTLALLAGVNNRVSVIVPASGGSLTEGLVGPVRFINPVLTLSDADEDLTQLVYSGLTRARADGTIIPDLAESYDISADGTTYTFRIRPDATFQDGTPVTSADVLYTVQEAQNPDVKSPHRADWEGVVVSAPDSHTIVFTLPHAYAPFIENTSIGILPEHLWKDVTPEEFPFSPLNTHPVGSGPYRVKSSATDSTGSATRYELVPFADFALGGAHVSDIVFRFYPNEKALIDAFNARDIDSIAGVSPEELASLRLSGKSVIAIPLPRVFGIFFNQSHSPVLADASARSALDLAIDRDRLITMVLHGYGVALTGPLPPGASGVDPPQAKASGAQVSTVYTQDSLDLARSALQKGGWALDPASGVWMKAKQPLAFTIATADSPELVDTANAVATAWKQLGAKVTVQVFPISDLNTSVIRPRNYDAILFGEVVGRSLDLYAFWHSSQRNDPGLNLALYANSKADTLLSQARAATNRQDRDKLYTQFAELLKKDEPAVFLYAPDFLYIAPEGLKGIELGALTEPAERYLNAYQWYTDTERVWSIFTKEPGL